jgi:hypothetical protein
MVSDGEKVMTLWVFKVETLPCHPSEATHAAGSVSHIYTIGDSLSSLCDGGVPGLAPGGLLAVRAPRDRSCARRERWGQLSFRAAARGGSGCRRSYARYGSGPAAARSALWNPLRFQKQIPLNGLELGSKPGSCLREGIGCSLPMLAAD